MLNYYLHPYFVKKKSFNTNLISGKFEKFAKSKEPDYRPSLNSIKRFLKPSIDYKIKKLGFFNETEKNTFPIFLTHDIDYLNITNSDYFKINYKKANFKEKIKMVVRQSAKILLKKLYRDFFELKEFNEKYNRPATYFFISDEILSRFESDGYYKLSEDIFSNLSSADEIGIHGQFLSHKNLKALNNEKIRLENISKRKIYSIRYHHLFFDNNITPNIEINAKFKFDLTLGFNLFNGYRRFTSIPIVAENNLGKICYIPLLYQDLVELRHKNFHSLSAFDAIKHCSKYGLPFTLLWHNCWIKNSQKEKRLKEILSYAMDNGGYFSTPNLFFKNKN